MRFVGAEALFARALDDLRAAKHYRTFRYLRRVVGLHPFVRMAVGNPLGDAAGAHSHAHTPAPALSTAQAMASGVPEACAERADACETCACERRDERWVINWCSNDYLNMSHEPKVRAAMRRAVDAQGAGAGGTRNISGSQTVHTQLERELAQLHGHEAALLFNSCYSANLGVMQVRL